MPRLFVFGLPQPGCSARRTVLVQEMPLAVVVIGEDPGEGGSVRPLSCVLRFYVTDFG